MKAETKRLALVTGAASGIGQALCRLLAAQGHAVYGVDIEEGEHVHGTLDVRDSKAWAATLAAAEAQFGAVPDFVCNVAGVLNLHWVHELDAQTVDLLIDVNVKGVIHGTRLAAAALMQANKPGHIVNVASLAALAPVPGLALYSATKHAVRAFSLSAALELKAHGIAVSVVCPDAVQTPMLDDQRGNERASLTFSGPKKPLTADDVANAIATKVMRTRPLELTIPRWRGAIAKIGGVSPKSGAAFLPGLRKRGAKQGGH